MRASISSINYCPVKTVSFQGVIESEIKKNIGIVGDKILAFLQNLNLETEKLFGYLQNERTKQFL